MLSLKQLKQYLQNKSVASLQELQHFLQEDASTIRCLLQYFIDRGSVMERTATTSCGTRCQKCPVAQRTQYLWVKGTNNSVAPLH